MDREEAHINEVKQEIIDVQSPPAIGWLLENLPPYFTEEVLMAACLFCPFHIRVEYVVKSLREHLGVDLVIHNRGNTSYRMNGAPKYSIRSDGNQRIGVLDFAPDTSYRKLVYCIRSKPKPVNVGDTDLRRMFRTWYEDHTMRFYSSGATPHNLPGVNPHNLPSADAAH